MLFCSLLLTEATVSSCLCGFSSFSSGIYKQLQEQIRGRFVGRGRLYNKPTHFNLFYYHMKKNTPKQHPPHKPKIQLKINSQHVTNNFILTPRTTSPTHHEHKHKPESLHQARQDKLKAEDTFTQKQHKDHKNQEQRRSTTDQAKISHKRKFEEDSTGTQTPVVRRASTTQEIFNKKKSYHSLVSSDKSKSKKAWDKQSKNVSGELNSATVQRVIGIIIKDYKEGRLRQKQLQQTLVELYDQKQKKKASKKKKKQGSKETFSNQFLKTASKQTKSQALRKRKPSNEEEDISERILHREGFVNQIIVKGITTSMFLKEDQSTANLKENARKPCRQYNIHTSNSVKQINEEMRLIQEQYLKVSPNMACSTLEQAMAIKIQRAWRRYRTRILLKKVAFCRLHENIFNIADEFTDEEGEPISNVIQHQAEEKKTDEQHFTSQHYSELAKIVINSLEQKQLSKDQCLKNILAFLKVPFIHPVNNQQEDVNSKQKISIQEVKSQEQNSEQDDIIESRVKALDLPVSDQKMNLQGLEDTPSNELEMNSFTNKYSSKQAIENNQFYKGKEVVEETEEMDKSLTFVHSQTVANQSFKSINIQNIEDALLSREQALNNKKEKQIEALTQKLFSNKVNREEYLKEKEKIDKWFKFQLKELKKVKNSLIRTCNQACQILQTDHFQPQPQKSSSMMKCLSDKYIKQQDWVIERNKAKQKIDSAKEKHLKAEEQEQNIRATHLGYKQTNQPYQEDEEVEYLIFNKKQANEPLEENTKLEMSPKIPKMAQESDDITDYKYEEVQRIIEDDEEAIEEGLVRFDHLQHQVSDKFVQHEEEEIQAHQISLISNYVSDHPYKFKYLCQQDKEDIFEFLFLDLVLEMFTEMMSGQNKILRAAQIYINKAKRLKKIPKGIKTNIPASKDYLNALSNYILRQKNGLKNLSHPMGPSAIEMLKYMRDEIVQTQDEEAVSSTLVMPIDVFQKVSRLPQLQLKLQRYYDDEEKEHNRLSFLKTALNINNKSLFDCLNEMLDHERPYGVWGKPFPWKKVLAMDRKWSRAQEQAKLKKCFQKTIESCSYLCGILIDKEDSLFGSHRVSEEYVMQIRQDRLSKMLANELIQNEERWIFYDDEETEIFIEVSSFITKKLIKEMVLQVVSLSMKR